MSDDLERDESILGTALSRAIESQPVRETPFARSRLMARLSAPRRSIVTPLFAAAAAIVLGLTLGAALLAGRGGERPPVAADPSRSPTAAATPSPAPTATPTTSPTAHTLRQRVYFTRDQLPPIGVDLDMTSASPVPPSEGGPLMAAARAKMRLEALARASAPPGAINAAAGLRATVRDVKVDGDLVTVDFTVPGVSWGVAGSSHLLGFLQQIVYTASEEPGLRRVLITQNGGQQALIDQAVIDRPTTRDALTGYDQFGLKYRIPSEASAGDFEVLADVVDWRASVDEVALGLGRFVVELRPTGPPKSDTWIPRFTAKLEPNTRTTPSDTHKWVLRLELPDAVWPDTPGQAFHCCPLRAVGKTPIRALAAYPLTGNERRGVGFAVLLDDPRPWRVAILQAPLRIVVDIGGVPQAVSDSIAVYAPPPVWAPGAAVDLTRELTVTGLARTFEANVQWRLLENLGQRVLAQGHTTASVGTSAVWGTFEFAVRVPSGTTGELTLEVFWASPRDGSAQGTVQLPLRVR